jgi:hypothetical protein
LPDTHVAEQVAGGNRILRLGLALSLWFAHVSWAGASAPAFAAE